ncbi:MAG TPA: L,D-transpeptidase [Anaerolineales bacterium]|nr:L,D-transpeptidase [Anaerolineales bacterium]
MKKTQLSRRDVLKLTGLGVGAFLARPLDYLFQLPQFPQADRLGRVTVGRVDIKARPDPESQTVGVLYEDAVLPWIREVTGVRPSYIFNNQRWVETPQGFIYGPYLQPVHNRPNTPAEDLPASSLGKGMWAEVTVPFAEAALVRGASSNSWVEARLDEGLPLRVYYSQVFWVDEMTTSSQGQLLYRINPNYYGGVDMLWVAAEAFRPITKEEFLPISPDVTDKRVVVDVSHQTLSCYEGNREVFFCRVSTGAKYDMYGNPVDKWATPLGSHIITRKYISLQMSGGTTGAGYDLPGIGWTSIFATGGVAIHSTFWHHNYGDPVSHGCVNALPEDAKWVFRWASPQVNYDPGMLDVTVNGEESTPVRVVEA